MKTLFENEDFILSLTGHDYDFVGTIEVKCEIPITFFFDYETDEDGEVFEDTTNLVDVRYGLKTDNDCEEMQGTLTCSHANGAIGFLSCPEQRGWFLALVKNYCPEQLSAISWA